MQLPPIELVSLLVDFGLVVLIWITQLITYPSFAYMSVTELLKWHPKYTTAITYIVMPLMLSQLFLHSYAVYHTLDWIFGIRLFLVLGAWIITFAWAVPQHQKISKGAVTPMILAQLVSMNWLRTIIWTTIFLLSIIAYS